MLKKESSWHNPVHESLQTGEIPEEKLMSTRNDWKWVVGRSTEGKAKCEASVQRRSLSVILGVLCCCPALGESFSETFSCLLIKCSFSVGWLTPWLSPGTCGMSPTKGAGMSSTGAAQGLPEQGADKAQGTWSSFKDQSGLTAER